MGRDAMGLSINLNGEPTELPRAMTVEQLLAHRELSEATCAVAVNGTFVPRHEHGCHELQAEDDVEIVAPMAGG